MLKIADRLKGLTFSKSSGQSAALAMQKEADKDIIDLSAGELKVEPPQAILTAIDKALAKPSNFYTETIGLSRLREQVAQRLSSDSGVEWKTDQVAITAGAKQALFNLSMTLLNPGDEILIPSPYWTTFPAQAQLVGACPVLVNLTPYNFSPVVDAFEFARTERTRILLLNSPNNPTGKVYSKNEWLELFKFAKKHDLTVIIDECYKDYCYPRAKYVSPAPLWDGPSEKLVLVNSFSKSLSLAGWRLGFVAAHSTLIEKIRTVQNHTTSNPTSLIQYVMSIALESTDFTDFIDTQWRKLDANRNTVLQNMHLIKRNPQCIPDGGFFFHIPTRDYAKANCSWADINVLCNEILRVTGVLVVPGTAFGDADGFRMSFCGNANDVEKGVNALNRFFDEGVF